MRYIVFAAAILGAILLYLLSHASANIAVSGQNYTLLLGLNIALAASLTLLIAYQLWKLYKQTKAEVIGSKLTLRLLSTFVLMAVIPGLIVYSVSVNFLTRSIESWFNVKVEAALAGGLSLGQSALDNLLNDLEQKGENMALSLSFQPESTHLTALNDIREKSGVQEALLLTPQGRIISFSSSDSSSFLPELPSVPQLRQARSRVYGVIEPIPLKGLYLRVLAPVSSADLHSDMRILQLLQPVPKSLSSTAESVQSVYQDYQELSLSRTALKEVFELSLTLVLMLAMLSAVSIAFVLSRRISAPIGILAEGTRAIARGDYSIVLPAHGKDELGVLVQSFNSMTKQLSEATKSAQRNQAEVEAARGYLEAILLHLTSGVMALDEQLNLRTFNPAAAEILHGDFTHSIGQPFSALSQSVPELHNFTQEVIEHSRVADENLWQSQIEITSSKGLQILLVRGTRLPSVVDGGYMVVFDDVTMLLQAQRDAAWGEVARRLAHEIKNPLTPIQLSAERLAHKLSAKLGEDDSAMLKRSTDTIVSQVGAMKNMVDAFSEYARAPSLTLLPLDINQLLQEVLALYESSSVILEVHLEDHLPKISGDATLLRQVLHNLLKNAQDALTLNESETLIQQARILVKSRLESGLIHLCISDNGCGFPQEMIARAFEPYVTTKRHGTGLGLAIVKKIIEEHKGKISIENQPEGGARVSIWLPVIEATA